MKLHYIRLFQFRKSQMPVLKKKKLKRVMNMNIKDRSFQGAYGSLSVASNIYRAEMTSLANVVHEIA